MNCRAIALVALMNLMFVFGKPSNPSVNTDALDASINYDEICDFHYNSKMTDPEIADLVTKGVNYAFDLDVIRNNIKKGSEKKEYQNSYYYKFRDNLEKANKKYKKNNIEARYGEVCEWWEILSCDTFRWNVSDEKCDEYCYWEGHRYGFEN